MHEREYELSLKLFDRWRVTYAMTMDEGVEDFEDCWAQLYNKYSFSSEKKEKIRGTDTCPRVESLPHIDACRGRTMERNRHAKLIVTGDITRRTIKWATKKTFASDCIRFHQL